jgi:hypothetical protein
MNPSKILLKTLSNAPGLENAFAKPKAWGSLAFSLYPEGITLGSLTQILGPGSTEALLRLFAEHPGAKVAWAEERLTAYPPGFVQGGANLNCLLFVEGGGHFAWALAQLLRSQLFKIVVAASPLKGQGQGLELRRLQLAAEQAGCAMILAAECEGPLWPLRLRLEARREGGELILARRDEGAPQQEIAL